MVTLLPPFSYEKITLIYIAIPAQMESGTLSPPFLSEKYIDQFQRNSEKGAVVDNKKWLMQLSHLVTISRRLRQ